MHPDISYAPDPDHPGWHSWTVEGLHYSNTLGKILVRTDEDGRGRCRMVPDASHSNILDVMHGGAILTFVDIAMFVGGHAAGLTDTGAVTLDCTAQFIAPGILGKPTDAVVELVRETGRLAFVRGIVEQEGSPIASFTGTLRKLSSK